MARGYDLSLTGARKAACAAIALALCALAASFAFASAAYADESGEQSTSVVGNAVAESLASSEWVRLGNDCVWAGEHCTLKGETIENDFLAAGRNVKVDGAQIGGSIRAAGQFVDVSEANVTENISIAGETTAVKGGHANDVTMAGRFAKFESECSGLQAFAQSVYIDGVVHGDARVAASTVEIGPHAVIEGTLNVSASAEPTIAEGATINKKVVKIDDNASSKQAASALAGLGSTMFIFGIITSIVGSLVVAVLSEWLFKRHTAASAGIIKERTGATIGTGIVGALVAPVAIVILFSLIVTIPIALALTLVLIAMTSVATGFMGASVFKLAFKNLGRFKTALAGGAIMGVASAIPFLGGLVTAVAFMYFLGYVLQSIFLNMKETDASSATPMPQG